MKKSRAYIVVWLYLFATARIIAHCTKENRFIKLKDEKNVRNVIVEIIHIHRTQFISNLSYFIQMKIHYIANPFEWQTYPKKKKEI